MNDLGNAFSFPFRDSSWFVKFLLGTLFMVLVVLLVGIFILAGYFIRVTQAVMRREPNPLVEWEDIGGMLVTGFKFILVFIVYSIPILLLYIPFVALVVMSEMAGTSPAGDLMTGMYATIAMFLIVPYGLALSLLQPVITYRFAAREQMGDALDIVEVVRAFRRNWQSTLIVALIAVGIQSFAAVGFVLFIVGVFFTIFYSYLVTAYLYGTLALEEQEKGTVAA
jgi:hypothetical protein